MNFDSEDCPTNCWIMSAIAGVIIAIILGFTSGLGWVWSIIIGIIVILLGGLLLRALLCGMGESGESAYGTAETDVSPAPASAPEPVTEAAPEPIAEPEPEPAPEPEPIVAATPEPEPEPEVAVEPESEPEPAPVEEVAADEPAQPSGLDEAREGGPDDLKRIKGVGPKLEQLLHSLGIYHFDQIAVWNASDVAWMDENLKGFKGRVTRDDWLGQAALLAAGEDTEFSRKVDDGDVY